MTNSMLSLARRLRWHPCLLSTPFLLATAAQAQSYTFSTLVNFSGTNGLSPNAGITLDGSGNLYGSTLSGGSSGGNGQGTVFKIAAGSHAFTTLVTFNDNGASTDSGTGRSPTGNLVVDSAGNIFGTAEAGGTSDDGTVFKIAVGTNTVTTLATFTGTANGAIPFAGLTLDGSGNLYGTTIGGGAGNQGTVFKIAAGTNALTTLATFTGAANGAQPYGSVTLDSSGNLYGTTTSGGASNDGTVFKIAAGTNTLTTLATFTGIANGANPFAGLTLDSGGNLYGTTDGGGASNDGTVFKIAAGTNAFSTIATFTGGANGAGPFGPVTFDSNGNLFGTTVGGGTNSDGTIFKIAADTHALTTLINFSSSTGFESVAGVTLDSSGNIYGTTDSGGSGNGGTIFKLTPVGSASAPEPGALVLLVGPAFVLGAARIRRRGRSTS